MTNQKPYPDWLYIVFPSVTMLLGWGLRGYIGGGPFGAMIPGAMVALSIAMLLNLSAKATSVLVVFAAVGIGIGGEMTYGQTLGFLRNPGTVWWGTLGTTVKGSVWGLLGAVIFAMGLLYKKLSRRTIIVAYLFMLAGMFVGFKLINQPMVIYFSDPAKPRPESWAALLFGALVLLVYLKTKISSNDYNLVSLFAIGGFVSGGLGFGLGGFWMVLGNQLSHDVIFDSWWKAMEFTFGMLLGAGLGLVVWLRRKDIEAIQMDSSSEPFFKSGPIWEDFSVFLLLAVVIFWAMPTLLDPIVDKGYTQGNFVWPNGVDLAKMLSNFAFFGFLIILAILYWPEVAWQMGITFTFCYAAIDFMQDALPGADTNSPFTLYFLLILIMTSVVSLLTAYFQRKENLIRNMFLLLVWSCTVVAFLRLGFFEKPTEISGMSLIKLIVGKFFVHIVFLASAIYISCVAVRRTK
jgi:hypothetical protein